MIRRLNRGCDLKDVITSYPTTVIDNIKTVKYYVLGGEDEAYTATMTRKGDTIECVIPTSALEEMPNGILYRVATYQVEDDSYPDGYYDLEMVDCLDVWLGKPDAATTDVYLTSNNVKTINGESIVGQGNIVIEGGGSGVTKEWVDSEIDTKTATALTGYAKTTDLPTKTSELTNDSGFLTEHQSIKTINGQSIIGDGNVQIGEGVSEAWVDSEIESKTATALEGYAKTTDIPTKTSELTNDSGYLTEHQSLEGYAKTTDIPTKTSQLTNDSGFLTEHQSLEGYATESWVEGKGYLTEHQTLKTVNGYSLIGEGNIVISGEGGVTIEQVDQEIANKITGYATEEWVEGKGYLTEHQSLEGYAKTSDVPTKTSQLTNDSDYQTSSQVDAYIELEKEKGYIASKNDIPTKTSQLTNDSTYQTKDEITAIIEGYGYAKSSDVPTKTSQLENDSTYQTKDAMTSYIEGYGYQTKYDVEKTIEGYGYAKTTDIPTKTSELTNDSGFLTEHQSLEGYATESWVEGKGYLTAVPDTYALKTDLPTKTSELTNDSGFLTEHQSLEGYATETWVEGKGYLTAVPDTYALKSDIPTKTSELTNDSGYLTEHQSLEGYATESWVEGKGYTTNTGTVTSIGVKMNDTVKGTVTDSGTIDLGTVLTEHQSLDDCMKKSVVNGGWNVTVNDSGNIKCTTNYTPSSTNNDNNFASLGTVRNFYNACVKSSAIWTGTQTEWDALTDEQKASYTIALIME